MNGFVVKFNIDCTITAIRLQTGKTVENLSLRGINCKTTAGEPQLFRTQLVHARQQIDVMYVALQFEQKIASLSACIMPIVCEGNLTVLSSETIDNGVHCIKYVKTLSLPLTYTPKQPTCITTLRPVCFKCNYSYTTIRSLITHYQSQYLAIVPEDYQNFLMEMSNEKLVNMN